MLRSIKSKINKTHVINSSNIIRELQHINRDTLELILASDLIDEGVYSLEVLSSPEHANFYLTTPSFFREDIGDECYVNFNYLKNSINDAKCYSIMTNKPSFLPIYTENVTSLLQNLTLLKSKNDNLFIQILFTQRSDHWQHDLINMYSEYLEGNSFPSSNRVARSVQHSLLKVLDKVSGYNSKRKEIPEISSKILDNGYRFEIRIITHTDDIDSFESELSDVLEEYDFFNELSYIKVKNKKQFIDDYLNRRLSDLSRNQILSETELISLIVDDQMVKDEKTISISNIQEEVKADIIKLPLNNISLLPIGVKKERSIDQEIVNELPIALKKARAIKEPYIEVIDVELGATVQRITFKIPKNHVYSDIKSKYEDIKSTLGEEISIVQGKEANTITFLIPCKQREIIYLKELLMNEEFQQFAQENPLPFVCGVGMYNELVLKCLTKAPHLLVAGATNSGKSAYINALLITLILLKSPNELRIFLIDPKKVEFIQYKGFAHVEDVIVDMNKAVDTLDKLVNEMESRYDKFSKLGVRKLDAYNAKSKSKLPFIICAIDEYNDLYTTNPEVETYIERLGQKARAAGIHLIIATQRPDKNVMSGIIKTNIPSRISFSLSNNNEYKTVFGTGIPYRNLLGFGDGVIKFVGQTEEFIRFQAPVITLDENEEEKVFGNIKKAYKGEIVEKIELEEVEEKESDLDRLKRIIANSGETRVGRLREEMGIRINVVSELMQQLVTEGWLEKPESKNKGYTLIASEEDLAEWIEW